MNDEKSDEKSLVKTEPNRKTLSPKASTRFDEIVAQKDLEKLKILGRALDIVGEYVKTHGEIARTKQKILLIESQKGLIDKEITKIETTAMAQGTVFQEKRRAISDVHQVMTRTIREDLPFLLEAFPEFDTKQKSDIVLEVLRKIPELKVEG